MADQNAATASSPAQPAVQPVHQATQGALGGGIAPNPEGRVQTTIDTDTTTIHPDASIINPVKPDGSDAPNVKKAVVGAEHQISDPALAAKAEATSGLNKGPASKAEADKEK